MASAVIGLLLPPSPNYITHLQTPRVLDLCGEFWPCRKSCRSPDTTCCVQTWASEKPLRLVKNIYLIYELLLLLLLQHIAAISHWISKTSCLCATTCEVEKMNVIFPSSFLLSSFFFFFFSSRPITHRKAIYHLPCHHMMVLVSRFFAPTSLTIERKVKVHCPKQAIKRVAIAILIEC